MAVNRGLTPEAVQVLFLDDSKVSEASRCQHFDELAVASLVAICVPRFQYLLIWKIWKRECEGRLSVTHGETHCR
ncbi:hypothetical protein MATL_G00081740 [Megalops atlanticus]|uniref:Uncharacterized protein n=1 Tax=Megalops atlanticus TaxID=7932 RepID=A0A9D3Q307_MEGAT|nr:hypothetical protein MATL_G00081740 [Megalops atlanticus]